MSRIQFVETVVAPTGPGGTLVPLSGVAATPYTINPDQSEGAVAITYAGRTGATAGNLISDSTGTIAFWLDVGDYNIHIDDQHVPIRIASYVRGMSQGVQFPLTSNEAAALAGSFGTPAAGNPYVTNTDPAQNNARTPVVHASSHKPGGADEILDGSVALLPAAPPDGEIISQRISSTAPSSVALWRMRYDSTLGHSPVWQFIGGPNLSQSVLANDARPSMDATYGDLGFTTGPTITMPVLPSGAWSGWYCEILWGAMIVAQETPYTSGTIGGLMSIAITGDASIPADSSAAANVIQFTAAGANFNSMSASVSYRAERMIPPGGVITCKYRNAVAPSGGAPNTASFQNRWLTVRPIQVY